MALSRRALRSSRLLCARRAGARAHERAGRPGGGACHRDPARTARRTGAALHGSLHVLGSSPGRHRAWREPVRRPARPICGRSRSRAHGGVVERPAHGLRAGLHAALRGPRPCRRSLADESGLALSRPGGCGDGGPRPHGRGTGAAPCIRGGVRGLEPRAGDSLRGRRAQRRARHGARRRRSPPRGSEKACRFRRGLGSCDRIEVVSPAVPAAARPRGAALRPVGSICRARRCGIPDRRSGLLALRLGLARLRRQRLGPAAEDDVARAPHAG